MDIYSSESEGEDSLHHGKYSPRNASFRKDAIRAFIEAKPRDPWKSHCSDLLNLQGKRRTDMTGEIHLEIETNDNRGGLLYVPKSYDSSSHPIPLIVVLHGPNGNGREALSLFKEIADSYTLLVMAPDSRLANWEMKAHSYCPDVAYLDRALELVFEKFCVDNTRLAIGGFADGATFALMCGLINGLLFSHIMAFTPDFVRLPCFRDAPQIFVSHGTLDKEIRIEFSSHKIVPRLRSQGHSVLFLEFHGGHEVPHEIAQAAVKWFLESSSS